MCRKGIRYSRICSSCWSSRSARNTRRRRNNRLMVGWFLWVFWLQLGLPISVFEDLASALEHAFCLQVALFGLATLNTRYGDDSNELFIACRLSPVGLWVACWLCTQEISEPSLASSFSGQCLWQLASSWGKADLDCGWSPFLAAQILCLEYLNNDRV